MTPEQTLSQHPRWTDQARCTRLGLNWLDLLDQDQQLADCNACPVRRECLAHAITTRAVGVTQAGIVIKSRPIHRRTWKDDAP